MGKGIVLGRFQPFHNGHAYLVEEAIALFGKVTIAIGSAQDEWTMDNPFSIQERTEMIQAWATANNHNNNITIVGIDDINDPPNWVKHASNHHGEGTLVTSTVYDDDATRMVLGPSVPESIIEWLIEADGLYRFLQINAGPHPG